MIYKFRKQKAVTQGGMTLDQLTSICRYWCKMTEGNRKSREEVWA